MSERRHYYDLLIDALSGHFHKTKQIRVSKNQLLDLLFARMNSSDRGAKSLVVEYRALYSPKGTMQQTTAAVRRAVTMLNGWFKQYYETHSELPIRFEINSEYRLVAVVQDGFDNRSVESLVKESESLISRIRVLATTADNLLSGRLTLEYADQYSHCLDELATSTARLNRISAAAKRRL